MELVQEAQNVADKFSAVQDKFSYLYLANNNHKYLNKTIFLYKELNTD